MQKRLLSIMLLGVVTVLVSCSFVADLFRPPGGTPPRKDPTDGRVMEQAEQLLASMTVREKVGQMLLIRPESLHPNLSPAQINDLHKFGATAVDLQMAATLADYPVGGIVLFGKNIQSPTQLTSFTDELQGNSVIPLFIGVDEEGGSVSRIANSAGFKVPKYTSMQAIGQTGDPENARKVGLTIGSYLKKYGVNLDFAPVADVNTNPDNIVIGNRSFGNDPNMVATMVTAAVAGLHEAGVMSCLKHFPGHGDTAADTHSEAVFINKSWDELRNCELIPFVAGIAAQTDMIMIAHITAENVTYDQLPATLSPEMLTGKLRIELGYQGVIITDSMFMGAITKHYRSGDAAVAAVLAGTDIVLMPEDFREAFDSICEAVSNGTISEARIDESVQRILSLKERYGLLGK